MSGSCPISFNQINEKAARINGALTVISLLVFIFTPFKLIIILLVLDFLIRGFFKPEYSFFSKKSKFILKLFKSEPKMTNAGPKLFAAKLGFVFSVIVAALHFLNLPLISNCIAAFFAFFAFLEAAFGLCIACKVYPLLMRLKKQ